MHLAHTKKRGHKGREREREKWQELKEKQNQKHKKDVKVTEKRTLNGKIDKSEWPVVIKENNTKVYD